MDSFLIDSSGPARFTFVLTANVSDVDAVRGTISWTLIHVSGSLSWLAPRVGNSGTENVEGEWDDLNRKLHLTGVSVNPPSGLIACDEYKLNVSADFSRIDGITRGNYGRWDNEFHGVAA